MALLGCDVVATDQRDVLPILARNIERNTPSLAQMNPSDSFGSIRAAELDWGNEYHIMAVGPPFDFIIGTDVVYAEHLLEPLLKTIHALSGPKTTIMLGYEIRSTNVHEQMLEMWKKNFEVKTVSQSKMDSQYQHPSIQLYIMGLKSAAGNAENTRDNIQQEIDTVCSRQENDKKDVSYDEKEIQEAEEPVRGDEDKKLGNWETRRMGSMAARLLQDVKIA
ncbi:protein-lysine methyltransferase METTL21D-like [Benincasa hispida]|nr:protein-lysine methyltransferase METTL21D-like [Benincasa hispida]